ASIGEVFSFLSGLYFRGKLLYATTFASPPPNTVGALAITSNRGLVPVDTPIVIDDLREMAEGDIDCGDTGYTYPLRRDIRQLFDSTEGQIEAVLLGSIATGKY